MNNNTQFNHDYNANLWDDRPYRPTSVTISIDEWDRMNKELEELRAKSESYDLYLESKGKVWFSKRDKDALLEEMQQEYVKNWSDLKTAGEMGITPPFKPESFDGNKVDTAGMDEGPYQWTSGTQDPDTSKEYGWHPKKDENYFAWDTNFGVQSFVNLNPEMGRIDMVRFGRLFPTKALAEAYGHTTTTNALLPLMELKMAVDRGGVIVDDGGNEIGKNEGQYYFRRSDLKLAHAVKSNEWSGVWCLGFVTTGWRIKPTEPDNYPLLMAYLGMGKELKAEDGTILKCDFDKEKGAFVGTDTVIHGLVPWSNVVEQILKRHKGWRCV